MTLLFDQNLSPRLAALLQDLFPGSSHVQSEGLDHASDDQIWEYARLKDLVIISKDEDYSDMSVVRGTPPKVIWLLLGSCTTGQVAASFRAKIDDIRGFEADLTVGTMVLR